MGEDIIGSIMVVFRFTSINPIIIFPINKPGLVIARVSKIVINGFIVSIGHSRLKVRKVSISFIHVMLN